jgi:hypothetical protein
MTLYRKQPACPYCGEGIKSVHNNMGRGFVGDTFLYWDYHTHNKTCQHHPLIKSKNQPKEGCINMGTFKIEITAVGGHGVDREPKEGESVNFYKEGNTAPDAIAKQFTEVLRTYGINVESAKLIHWPGSESEVTDDLLNSKREKGNF